MPKYTPKYTHTIYLIQINGVPYVGQTSSYATRKRDHLSALRSERHHNIHLQRAYAKYGELSLNWSILERCYEHEANSKERHWVKFFDAYNNGFNQDEGGAIAVSRRECTWNGISYPSLSAAAEANNCRVTTMQRRLDAGYICDADVPSKGAAHSISVTWNNIQYPSISHCAIVNNVSISVMRQKIKNGYTCDNDVPAQAEWSRKPCTWGGIEYVSLAECSRQLNIPANTLSQWLSRGYTCNADVKPSIKLDLQKANEIRALFANEGLSYSQIAKRYNVSSALVSLVIRNKLWNE